MNKTNKYTFVIKTNNNENLVKSFEDMNCISASQQLKNYFKDNLKSFELAIAKNAKGNVVFEKPELMQDVCRFENEQLKLLELAKLYESKWFKLAFLAIVAGAAVCGFVISLIVSGR